MTFEGEHYLIKGGIAEQYAYDLLCHSFPEHDIIDVRDDPVYQRQDVDYLVKDIRSEKRIEVKYDKWLDNGNFCFEVMRIRHDTNNPDPLYIGWSVRTNTHVILMWHDPTQTMYIVYHWALVEGLQRYAKAASKNNQRINSQTVHTDSKRTTVNIYVPQTFVAHYKFIYENETWVKIGEE